MAKKPDTQDLAIRVKTRQIGMKDIPADLKSDVLKHLTGAGETKLVQRMRAQKASAMGDRTYQRVHQRFVAG